MTKFVSTMGAQLTAEETYRILSDWSDLWRHCLAAPEEPEPVDMLSYITETIMLCYEVRRAIDDGWYHANKRAFPGPRTVPKTSHSSAVAKYAARLEELGLTEVELGEILATVRGGHK